MEVLDIDTVNMPQLRHMTRMVGGDQSNENIKNLLICNDILWEKSFIRQPYRASVSAFILCTKGEMTLMAGIKKYTLRKNCVMLYGRDNIIEVLEKSDDFTFSVMILSEKFTATGLLNLKAIIPIYQYLTEKNNDLLQLADDEVAVIKKYLSLITDISRTGNEPATLNLITSLFYAVSDIYGKRVADEVPVRSMRTRQEEYFERFLKAVSADYKEQRSVQYYADKLHITPKYLSTVIKEASGRSAADWIDEFVIQEAKVLLKFSSKSIQEITYHLNFSTQSFFGKYFKRHTGISPSEYRSN